MTVKAMEILGRDGENFPLLSLERTRDALATYCAVRWPNGRRKAIEREWDLTSEQARSVVEASASSATLDEIWLHPRGGWAVLFPVFGALLNETAEEFIQKERRRHVERAGRLRSLARDIRAGGALRLGGGG